MKKKVLLVVLVVIQLTNHSLKLTQGSMTSFLSFIIHENNRVV